MLSKEHLREQYRDLQHLRETTEQKRGFELERLIIELAAFEGLECRAPFRPQGEQVDGLLRLDNRFFLIEAKWTNAPAPASEIYAFRAKVEGKLVGTIGIYVSMSGFADAVPDVLRFGKEINILLMDGTDIWLALQDQHGLAAVISAKLLRAAQYGEVYYTFQRHLDEQTG